MWMQPPPAPPSSAREPTVVSGVEVTARGAPPKVVASYPAPGQTVAPGALVLMVRFDHRMAPDAWNYGAGADAPTCLDKPRLLQDERTFVLMCSLGFNQHFALNVNGGPKGFVDAARVAAQPYPLAFSTSGAEPVADVADALKAAGLADVDSPILDSEPARAPGAEPTVASARP